MSRAVELMNDEIKQFLSQSERLDGALDTVAEMKEDYDGHVAGTAGRHTADDIDYATGKTVRERIVELAQGGGGITVHNELAGRDAADAHPISAITGLESRIEEAITGLESKIGEVIVFEGETTGAQTVALKSSQESDFVHTIGTYAGNFTMPEGMAANVEILAASVAADGGEITSRTGTCFFRTQGAIARIGVVPRFSLDTVQVYDMKEDPEAGTPELQIKASGTKTVELRATGVVGLNLKWRAEIRLKNIVDLGEASE